MLKAAIIMGSDSDLGVLSAAAKILEQFDIPFEIKILSAHRTTEAALSFAVAAEKKGFGVLIAGAGGAAHLPGVLAAATTLPVIGVPVRTKTLDGLDSLLSIVQMPPGIPVATVAVDGARNAGLLAARILATSRPELARRLSDYAARMESEVIAKAGRLEKAGPEGYSKQAQEAVS